MTDVSVLAEPRVQFRHDQAVVDPRDGLALFGPFDSDLPYHPASLSYGIIGTEDGIAQFLRFSPVMQGPVHTPIGKDPRLWPTFPGFDAAFQMHWPTRPSKQFAIDGAALDAESRNNDPNIRANAVVNRYLAEIRRIYEGDEQVNVVICVVPESIYKRCRPKSFIPLGEGLGLRTSAAERKERAHGQTDIWGSYDPRIYQHSPDFRRQLKARCMEYGIPIQIVRDSTLRLSDEGTPGERGLTSLSDRAWNLGVALYYKARGKPWRLASAREGVCYIGLAYRLAETGGRKGTAACAAQMFLDSGDGIVFMGRFGPWYSKKKDEFHLTKDAARELLEGTLKTYESLQGQPLKEIFLHCRSGINSTEFAGFKDACPGGVRLVGVRVRRDPSVRLLREGTRPVLRGTFWPVNSRTGFLWASGFKPRLGTYDGWETPAPLRIDVQQGDAVIEQVATDILGLTKLNYNACRLGESQPVTIKFSDAVGEILVSNPGVKNPSPSFRFYV